MDITDLCKNVRSKFYEINKFKNSWRHLTIKINVEDDSHSTAFDDHNSIGLPTQDKTAETRLCVIIYS